MKLQRYNNFKKINEGIFGYDIIKLLKPAYGLIKKKSSVQKIYNSLTDGLDEYKDYLMDMAENKHNMDTLIESDLERINNELDNNITHELNIESFFRTIELILHVPKKRSADKVYYKFEEYYESLKERIERCLESDMVPTIDEEEGEISVLSRGEFLEEMRGLQAEMNKLVEDVVKNGRRVAILCDGRDSAGKGSAIKSITQYMNPKHFRVVVMGIPKKEDLEGENWFNLYNAQMPKSGEIVFFDRSYYNMAINNPTFGYCTEDQYRYFMENVNRFESDLIKEGVELFKFWFSITKEKQKERFELRINSPLKYWKFSPNDAKAAEKWDVFTKFKEQCFRKASTAKAPFVVVQSNDKKLARLNTLRYILNRLYYDGKDESVIGDTYTEVVYEIK